jgi:hypothetical protein
MASSNGIFWLSSKGASTSERAAKPTGTASTESMKLGAVEYSARVEANLS